MGIIKRLYICDNRRRCSLNRGCILNGGECRHTTELIHARSGGFTVEEQGGELILPDNIETIRANDGNIILIEREETRSAES